MKRRAVITGIGMVTPLGNSAETFWANLTAGRSGIGPITLFDATQFPVRIGGQVRDLDLASVLQHFPNAAGERDRKVMLGLAALEQAVANAGLAAMDLQAAQIHVGVSLESFCLEDLTPLAHEADMSSALPEQLASSTRALQTPLDRIATLAGQHYGIDACFANCSACAAGAQAIGQALRSIQFGDADVAIAGGADSMLNPLGLGGFSLLRILSAENDTPTRACRPFDVTRQGTVLGEGAAFLIIEELGHARQRHAKLLAELRGYGSSMDAFRLSDPQPTGRGAVLAMRGALDDAGLQPAEIDCLNAHATGTPKNDVVETAAIKKVLGARARQIPVHAVKSMTGHLIAASGAVEAAAAVLTLWHHVVPPTINLDKPDPDCDLDYCPHTSRPFSGRVILSNSFGFGGQNASLVLTAPPVDP